MDLEDIRKNNILIAEFMGAKTYHSVIIRSVVFLDSSTVEGDFVEAYRDKNLFTGGYKKKMMSSNLAFHKSWEWLMPVVDKIQHLGYRFYLESNEQSTCVYFTDLSIPGKTVIKFESILSTMLETLYTGVVNFIEWYNNQ